MGEGGGGLGGGGHQQGSVDLPPPVGTWRYVDCILYAILPFYPNVRIISNKYIQIRRYVPLYGINLKVMLVMGRVL